MKPDATQPLPPRTRLTTDVTAHGLRIALGCLMTVCLVPLSLCATATGLAAPAEPGRLFYTPAQRAQLETARVHQATQRNGSTPDSAPAPVRFDGMVIRSDGKSTRWVDGKPQVGAAGVSGLKPGQIRADGKVYEPYQVLRPAPQGPAEPGTKDSAP